MRRLTRLIGEIINSLLCLTGVFGLLVASAYAMTPMTESQMQSVTGTGIALSAEDFDFLVSPTTYIEAIGSAPPSLASNIAPWYRADLRWYGLSISGTSGNTDWYAESHGNTGGCSPTAGASTAGICPIGGPIPYFAPHDNPYVLRVFNYLHNDYGGDLYTYAGATATSSPQTVLELLGPSDTDTYRWSFWGELEVGKTSTGNSGLLQSETIIRGKPTTTDGKGSVLRLLQNTDASDPTLSLIYHSRLSGDFRFSVAQTSTSPDAINQIPDFNDAEGMYFKNVDAYLPLGLMFYQTIILDDTPAHDGNFSIELTRIPGDSTTCNSACQDAYSLMSGDSGGYETAYTAITDSSNSSLKKRYFDTHGYARWGDVANPPSISNQTQGIYFVQSSSITSPSITPAATRPAPDNASYGGTSYASVNLGSSRVEGLLIQHLKISSCGAGGSNASTC